MVLFPTSYPGPHFWVLDVQEISDCDNEVFIFYCLYNLFKNMHPSITMHLSLTLSDIFASDDDDDDDYYYYYFIVRWTCVVDMIHVRHDFHCVESLFTLWVRDERCESYYQVSRSSKRTTTPLSGGSTWTVAGRGCGDSCECLEVTPSASAWLRAVRGRLWSGLCRCQRPLL